MNLSKIASPILEKGDIIIDGGNSLFTDTKRRCKESERKGILFIGREFQEAKKARAMVLPSCLEEIPSLAPCQRYFSVHCRQSRQWRALLRLGGR